MVLGHEFQLAILQVQGAALPSAHFIVRKGSNNWILLGRQQVSLHLAAGSRSENKASTVRALRQLRALGDYHRFASFHILPVFFHANPSP